MSDSFRVALTRARGGNGELAARLRAVGLDVVECPLVRIEPIDGPPLCVEGYDWLVLTSRAGADLALERVDGPLPRVAAIGPGTATALRSRGVEPKLVASRSTQEGLVAEFPRPSGRVLFLGAEGARDVIVRELGADFVPLYRTVEERPGKFPEVHLVVLASASAARAFAALGIDLPCVSIGPVTSRQAQRLGLDVFTEAAGPALEALVEAVKLAASSIASSRS
jgi:uroporphyrinogen III methyltransferase / synthase